MSYTVSFKAFVKKRNGVPLGANHSMRNMLHRSLGASSFATFWHYWNPIWGYYLARYIMKPLNTVLPVWLAIFGTFAVSGALHDVAVSLVKWRPVIFFTPWFSLMAVVVIASKYFAISYRFNPWGIRAIINLVQIGITLGMAYLLESLIAAW